MSLVKQDYKSLQRLFPSEVPKGMDAAANSLVGEEQLGTNRDLVYKEDQFYIIAIAVLLLTFPLAAIYNPIPP